MGAIAPAAPAPPCLLCTAASAAAACCLSALDLRARALTVTLLSIKKSSEFPALSVRTFLPAWGTQTRGVCAPPLCCPLAVQGGGELPSRPGADRLGRPSRSHPAVMEQAGTAASDAEQQEASRLRSQVAELQEEESLRGFGLGEPCIQMPRPLIAQPLAVLARSRRRCRRRSCPATDRSSLEACPGEGQLSSLVRVAFPFCDATPSHSRASVQVHRLHQKLEHFHVSDYNALRRAHRSLVQHVEALEAEVRTGAGRGGRPCCRQWQRGVGWHGRAGHRAAACWPWAGSQPSLLLFAARRRPPRSSAPPAAAPPLTLLLLLLPLPSVRSRAACWLIYRALRQKPCHRRWWRKRCAELPASAYRPARNAQAPVC